MAPDVRPSDADQIDFSFPDGLKASKENQFAEYLRDNPILTKAQVTLKEQLLERKQDLEERLREKGFVLKTATKKRQDAGVKLYGLQKTLATLQMSLKSANEQLAKTSVEHLKADEELSRIQKQHKDKYAELSLLKAKTEKSKQELNSLEQALKQIESYNEKLKGDIAVNRRVTYATEEHIVQAEKEKKHQDFLIAHLQQQIKRQQEKQSLCKAKLTAQQRETQVARSALTEAEIEMESIKSEKKQITMQWKSSLVVLARCDEALQSLHEAINKQKEQQTAVEGEKHSLRKAIKKEHGIAEQHVSLLSSIDNRIKVTQRKMQQIVAKRLKYLEEYTTVLVSLQDLEASEDKVIKETAIVQGEKQVVEKEMLKESQELIDLEDKMIKSLGEQVTLERSHQKLVQQILSIRQEVKKEDKMVTELEFELAQIRNDVIKVQTYNQNVRNALSTLDSEINQKLLMVSKMETETKRKRCEVDVKTKEIDRLNKQYDKLTANFVDKNFTPWDHMISNITYEISVKVKASTQLQKQWLGMQANLVNLTSENSCLSENVHKLGSEQLALVQRNQRLEREFGLLSKNIKDLDNSTRVKHNMIIRLNDLIAKNATLQEFLENENYNIHAYNVSALKDLERNLSKLDTNLRDSSKEKDDISKEVAELQYHIKLWTSKISFEKQTQDTLMRAIMGPKAMTTALKKELDRLKLKLENLGCIKERILSSVETRVSNRKAIFVKLQAASQRKGDGPNCEETLNIKIVAELRRQIREARRHTTALDGRLEIMKDKKEDLEKQYEELDQNVSKMNNQQEHLRLKLKEASFNKTNQLLVTALHQRMVKRHHEFKAGKWKVQMKLTLEEELSESQRKCIVLHELVQTFARDMPQLQDKLNIIALQLNLTIKMG